MTLPGVVAPKRDRVLKLVELEPETPAPRQRDTLCAEIALMLLDLEMDLRMGELTQSTALYWAQKAREIGERCERLAEVVGE